MLIIKEGENSNEAKLVSVQFCKDEARKAITEYIVMRKLSFRYVESKAFKRLIQKIYTKLLTSSQMIISRDVNKIYLDEKEKLNKVLKNKRIQSPQIHRHQLKT